MTYPASTIAYWVGQANDLSTGAHPPGWTSGQRWSETAGEWKAVYDSSQAALAAMTADRDTWTGRANQAYGPGRVWNSPPSFEDQAWTGSGYGSGVLWSDAAHNDPDVWNTRYNAGYSAGYAASTAAIAPYTQLTVGLGNLALTGTFQQVGTVTLTRTGNWHISFANSLGDGGDISNWAYCELQNFSAGGTVLTAAMGRMRYAGVNVNIGGQATGIFNSGTIIRLYARVSGSGNWSIDGNGQLIATFSPTPTYPA